MPRNISFARALIVVSLLPLAACVTHEVTVEVEVHEGGGHRPPPPPPPTCQDGVRNGAETGVDCGGPVCQPCPGDCSTRLILAAMTPTAGPVGTEVDLVGVGFRAVTELELNGVAVAFVVDNDSHIVFQVPAGVSSGAVTLTAPCGSVDSPADFSVLRLRSETAIATSDNPSIAGRPVTFTATVSSSLPSPATPTGTVYFRSGDEILAAVALTGGTASTTIALPAGSHAITAEYGGDVDFESSVSPELQQAVNPDAPSIVGIPGVYDPTESGTVFSDWLPGLGVNGPGDTSAQGLLLRKDTATATPVAAFVDVVGVEGLDACALELGFDYFLQGHCGAGAPRFSLWTADDKVYFFGCRYGQHSSGPAGFGRVRYTRSDAIPAMTTCSPVTRLLIVMDEGTDTPRNDTVITPGFAILDNVWLRFGGTEVVLGGPDPVYY